MLTNRTLARINNRPRSVGRLPLLIIGAGALVLAALLYALDVLPAFAALAVLGGGVLLVVLLYVSQRSKANISLSYKGNLTEEAASRSFEVQGALEGLSTSEVVWRMPGSAPLANASEVAPTPEREATRVGLLPTPGIKADVPVWGIEAGEQTIYFFPEGLLLYRGDHYEPVSYKALKLVFSSGRFFEEEDLPSDATVVEKTWRFSRPDGSPDPRYKKDNYEIPVVLYSLLDIKGPSGLDMRLMVSNRRAAARFARTFDAEDLREKRRKVRPEGTSSGRTSGQSSSGEQNGREEPRRSKQDLEREAKLATARKTLGVSKGAAAGEISAAYRELARTHHPDKVANLEPEVREYSEQRMKEINAAYALLKGQRDPVLGGAKPA